MNAMIQHAVANQLGKYYDNAENTEKVIIQCALAATAADFVGGLIPGIAIPATIVSCFGAVWVMYGRLCGELGITLKEHTLKLLARAAIANISANLGGALIAMAAGMFIPVASDIISMMVTFITVYLAGHVFLTTILTMAEKSSDPQSFSDISESEMKKAVKEVKVSKDDMEAAKEVFEQNKQDK